jgi:threonine dehydrogenase-like Zn-dependent dehydrogenase
MELEVGVEVAVEPAVETDVVVTGAGPVGVAPAVIPWSGGVTYVVTDRSAVSVGTRVKVSALVDA